MGSAIVLRGDARSLPLPDGCADLIVTSPPYFGLRSYTDGGEHYGGQIGSEATPREYVASLLDCTREWVRALKPSGSIFVNLGDKYAGSAAAVPAAKSLLGLPWRYALGCVDDLGLILRAEIIWSKLNGLPESVTDRVRRSHEQVFHFTREPRYYSAVDDVREEHAPQSIARTRRRYDAGDLFSVGTPNTLDPARFCNPLGKLPGSVWDIASQPLIAPAALNVDHFAAFPMELPRRIILGWSPPGVCTRCDEGRRPVSMTTLTNNRGGRQWNVLESHPERSTATLGRERVVSITGYACACPDVSAATRPALVVDPFGGTGTTAVVASVFGRNAITVDRSADYCRLAAWRTTNPAERAKAMQVPKPPPVLAGQESLFG